MKHEKPKNRPQSKQNQERTTLPPQTPLLERLWGDYDERKHTSATEESSKKDEDQTAAFDIDAVWVSRIRI